MIDLPSEVVTSGAANERIKKTGLEGAVNFQRLMPITLQR